MSRSWTAAQQSAIEAEGCELVVSAAAGSGKTAVLVERVVRAVLDAERPVEITSILVVTFTRAAAAEMRERLARLLQERLERRPGDMRIRRQLALLPAASISTLHSFCQVLVRQHFHQLEIDPGFRLLDAEEARLRQMDTVEETLEAAYGAGRPEFLALVRGLGGRGGDFDANLRALLIGLSEQARSSRDPDAWLARLIDHYNPSAALDETVWSGFLMASVRRRLASAALHLQQAARLAEEAGHAAAGGQLRQEHAAMLDLLHHARDWRNWAEHRPSGAGDLFATLRFPRGSDEIEKKAIQAARARGRRELDLLIGGPAGRDEESLLNEIRILQPRVRELVRLAGDSRRRYDEGKREDGLLDFSDLEHQALRLLSYGPGADGKPVPTSTALQLRERYEQVLVDECQDLNDVQEALIRLLSRPGPAPPPNLFMVGDVKQCIYQFRQADPRLFAAAHAELQDLPEQAAAGGRYRLSMSGNFRSRAGVVAAVNDIFCQLLSPELGAVEYDDAARLEPRAEFPEAGEVAVELLLVRSQEEQPEKDEPQPLEEEEQSDPDPPGDLQQEEARQVGLCIRALVDPRSPAQVLDRETGRMRPCRLRDIAVLLRSSSGSEERLMEELRRLSIPVSGRGDSYLHAMEVRQVLDLLELLDNPRQDIPLAAVLRGPIGGFSEEELLLFRRRGGEGPFHQAILSLAEQESGEDEAGLLRLRRFLNRLDEWRSFARSQPVSRLLQRLLSDTGFDLWCLALPSGRQRMANLEGLLQRARQFDEFSRHGIGRFLRFIRDLQERDQGLRIATPLPEGADMVRVMTIHGSKGLEFPVVILAGLGRRFPLPRATDLDADLGPALAFYDSSAHARWPSAASAAAAESMRLRSLGEEARLLYVAMTRARERLILTGHVRDLEADTGRWAAAAEASGELGRAALLGARGPLDWLIPAAARLPGSGAVRRLLGLDAAPVQTGWGDGSRWLLRESYQPAATAPPAQDFSLERIASAQPLDLPGDPHLEDSLSRLCRWLYPARLIAGRYGKWSVSELKRSFDPELARQPLPAWVRGGDPKLPGIAAGSGAAGAGALDRGRLVHRFLQHLDLASAGGQSDLKKQLDALEERGIMPPGRLGSADLARLARFFDTPLGRRIRMAGSRAHREVMFTLALPAEEVLPEASAGDGFLIVQGIIDLLIEDDDGLTLVDYKTDRLSGRRGSELAPRYAAQMACYARAAEDAWARPVRELLLVFLDSGEVVPVDSTRFRWMALHPDQAPWAAEMPAHPAYPE